MALLGKWLTHRNSLQETLQRLLSILDSIEKLERMLKIRHVLEDGQEDEQVSEIERLASKYVFNIDKRDYG